MSAIEKDIKDRFGGDVLKLNFLVAHSNNYDEAEIFCKQVKERFGIDKVHVAQLSLSVACHIGAGSLVLAVSKKVDF